MNKKRILLIEDDPVLSEAIKIELETKGFEVIVHYEGSLAIEKIRETNPDLIILDLVLPGVHGFHILETIKKDKNYQHIPVIVATNLGEESDKKTSYALGADDYFIKALVDLDDLSKKIIRKIS